MGTSGFFVVISSPIILLAEYWKLTPCGLLSWAGSVGFPPHPHPGLCVCVPEVQIGTANAHEALVKFITFPQRVPKLGLMVALGRGWRKRKTHNITLVVKSRDAAGMVLFV